MRRWSAKCRGLLAIYALMRQQRLSKVWLFVRYLQHQLAKVLAIK